MTHVKITPDKTTVSGADGSADLLSQRPNLTAHPKQSSMWHQRTHRPCAVLHTTPPGELTVSPGQDIQSHFRICNMQKGTQTVGLKMCSRPACSRPKQCTENLLALKEHIRTGRKSTAHAMGQWGSTVNQVVTEKARHHQPFWGSHKAFGGSQATHRGTHQMALTQTKTLSQLVAAKRQTELCNRPGTQCTSCVGCKLQIKNRVGRSKKH